MVIVLNLLIKKIRERGWDNTGLKSEFIGCTRTVLIPLSNDINRLLSNISTARPLEIQITNHLSKIKIELPLKLTTHYARRFKWN